VNVVTRLHNHLMVMLAAEDYRDDPMLTTAANNALALAVTVPGNILSDDHRVAPQFAAHAARQRPGSP
jgi:hypothetical protein